jgi:hypothetical protein
MTKASKADVEMLKKLVIEFKDELDALGVQVDELDKRVAVFESRLGGWKLGGQLRLDGRYNDKDGVDGHQTGVDFARGRIYFDRRFGEDESIHAFARLDIAGGTTPTSGPQRVFWENFYVEMPVAWDIQLTVGRVQWNFESPYYFGGILTLGSDAWLTDRYTDILGLSKTFGLGKVTGYVARPGYRNNDGLETWNGNAGAPENNMWEIFGAGQFEINEQFGFDLGFQYFNGDDDSSSFMTEDTTEWRFDNLWTIFGGLRFKFNESIALKGIYYRQGSSVSGRRDEIDWVDLSDVFGDSSAYKIILDVDQDLLKFTSLWLEYDKLEADFYMPTGIYGHRVGNVTPSYGFGMPDDRKLSNATGSATGYVLNDTTIWRIGAVQKWNDKWKTALFYSQYKWDFAGDPSAAQYGLGVSYMLNPSTEIALSYTKVDYDSAAEVLEAADESHIRFRTQVTF